MTAQTAQIIDFETAAAERSIRMSNASIMRDAVQLPDCFERDLMIAVARSDWDEIDRLSAQPHEQRKRSFKQWLAAMNAN